MSTVIVRRRERREGPDMPDGEIVLEPPPEIPEVAGDALQQMLTYLPMLAMTFGMVAMMSGTGSGALRWVGGGALGLGMGGMALGQMARGRGDRKLKLNGLRRDYLRYLGQVRRKVRRVAAAQRQALAWASPEPANSTRSRATSMCIRSSTTASATAWSDRRRFESHPISHLRRLSRALTRAWKSSLTQGNIESRFG